MQRLDRTGILANDRDELRDLPGGHHDRIAQDDPLVAHAQQRRAVDFALPPDVVVNAGMNRAPVLVLPGFLSLIFIVDEDGLGTLVVLLSRQIAATL